VNPFILTPSMHIICLYTYRGGRTRRTMHARCVRNSRCRLPCHCHRGMLAPPACSCWIIIIATLLAISLSPQTHRDDRVNMTERYR
jgi:hypothetical protein